jgi:hypothetical protein
MSIPEPLPTQNLEDNEIRCYVHVFCKYDKLPNIVKITESDKISQLEREIESLKSQLKSAKDRFARLGHRIARVDEEIPVGVIISFAVVSLIGFVLSAYRLKS